MLRSNFIKILYQFFHTSNADIDIDIHVLDSTTLSHISTRKTIHGANILGIAQH